jgi:hypothetical protein
MNGICVSFFIYCNNKYIDSLVDHRILSEKKRVDHRISVVVAFACPIPPLLDSLTVRDWWKGTNRLLTVVSQQERAPVISDSIRSYDASLSLTRWQKHGPRRKAISIYTRGRPSLLGGEIAIRSHPSMLSFVLEHAVADPGSPASSSRPSTQHAL